MFKASRMTQIVLVQKTGKLKELNVKNLNRDELYKKAGLKNPDNFRCRNIWEVNIDKKNITVELWAKDDGKANSENKYDFPPPIDEVLYFGTCLLLRNNSDNGQFMDITISMWERIYEKLFGGFEDLDDNDSISEDELDNLPDNLKTKHGYLKDDFIVDEDGSDDRDDDDDDGCENIVVNTDNQIFTSSKNKNNDCSSSDEDYNNNSDGELIEDEYYYTSDET